MKIHRPKEPFDLQVKTAVFFLFIENLSSLTAMTKQKNRFKRPGNLA